MTQNWSILAKFPPKNPAKSAVFYWLFHDEVSPRNFPWNRPIFLRICLWKSFEIWLFSAKIPRNRPIFARICPWKSCKILLFFSRKIRSPGVCVCIGFSEFNKQAMCKISCSHFSPSCCLYYLFKQSTAHISFWLSFAILWVDWSINIIIITGVASHWR